MQKVKVHRYVSGKRPDYAPASTSEEESDDEGFIEQQRQKPNKRAHSRSPKHNEVQDISYNIEKDPRWRRLEKIRKMSSDESDTEKRLERHRFLKLLRCILKVYVPIIRCKEFFLFGRHIHEPEVIEEGEPEKEKRDDESSDEGDLSDEEIERRRELLKQKLLNRKKEGVMLP